MLSIASLWLPILLSAVVVWLVSSVIWMFLPWHKADWRALPNEEAARNALRNVPPGQYNLPHCAKREEMKKPEFQRKATEGPIAYLTVLPNGMPSMARQMILWFVYVVLTGILVAYVATRTLAPGVDYLEVFQIVGTVAWLAYGWAGVTEGIWFGRPWRAVLGLQLDALIYALLSAGVFGWLWPGS